MSDSIDGEADLLTTTYPNRGDSTLLGASEPDSPWTLSGLSGLLTGATSVAGQVGSTLNAFNQPKQPENVKVNNPAYKPPGLSQNTLLLIAGAVVLVIVGIFLTRK